MGAGFFGLLAGGFLGYHLAKERSAAYHEDRCHGWGSGRGWGGRQQQPVDASAGNNASPPVTEKTFEVPSTPVPVSMDSHEFALFQQWKQQHPPAAPNFFGLQQPPNYNMESVKAGAVEGADKALDAILGQVQGLKEKLAQHKMPEVRSVPASPRSEQGEYKLV